MDAVRAVQIAQDVLRSLPDHVSVDHGWGYFTPTHKGRFLHTDLLVREGGATPDEVLATECKVCAQGAMFIGSMVHRDTDDRVRYTDMADLSEVFGEVAWNDIENAYEGWQGQSRWLDIYPEPKDRLRAICENIIRNGGSFLVNDTIGWPDDEVLSPELVGAL